MNHSLKILGLMIAALAVAVPAFATTVPEIDPSVAASGLAALVGGVLVLRGRQRRK